MRRSAWNEDVSAEVQPWLVDDSPTAGVGFPSKVEVERGEEHEDATGATLDEALSAVSQMVAAEFAGHVP